jgi:hypothetical protein
VGTAPSVAVSAVLAFAHAVFSATLLALALASAFLPSLYKLDDQILAP